MWRLGVTRQGILSRAEWVTAAYTYAFDTLTQLKTKVGEWTSEVKSKKEVFAIMYNFLYDYVRGEEDRIASTESAVAAWGVLFPGDPLMLSWNKWAKEVYAEQVSRDLWRQVLLFKNAYEENREFPVDKPWPSAIIDFCTWHKAQKG
ncbi:hypothetical protein AGDE_01404 [Angomonas deanei]|nr:hypothetical protein AGDE_01404 [Angomonas deanei]|eukprot:EPY42519.1 hypothetical protein AGDE_01404 [Angomonas deanei]